MQTPTRLTGAIYPRRISVRKEKPRQKTRRDLPNFSYRVDYEGSGGARMSRGKIPASIHLVQVVLGAGLLPREDEKNLQPEITRNELFAVTDE